MSRLSLFNSPLLLGFDQIEEMLDRLSKATGDSYPPYNIEQMGPDGLRITLAVAGFAPADLAVTVENNQLVIRGKHAETGQRAFIHRGIASRQFQRVFVLAEGIEVASAQLDNGLLNIDLVRPKAESRVRNVEITSGQNASTASPNGRGQTIDLSADNGPA